MLATSWLHAPRRAHLIKRGRCQAHERHGVQLWPAAVLHTAALRFARAALRSRVACRLPRRGAGWSAAPCSTCAAHSAASARASACEGTERSCLPGVRTGLRSSSTWKCPALSCAGWRTGKCLCHRVVMRASGVAAAAAHACLQPGAPTVQASTWTSLKKRPLAAASSGCSASRAPALLPACRWRCNEALAQQPHTPT